jgi:tetratricopeptide (TPR) repeat protein
MKLVCSKGALYSVVCIVGLACILFGAQQLHYTRLLAAGNQAVLEQRFDSREYERAQRSWMARHDLLLFNQGVLAFKAQNLSRAAEHFRQASQTTHNTQIRMQSLYNLGLVMLALEEVQAAAELFKEALRVDPTDNDAKFNLERLYHFVLRQESSEHGEAALEQAPGADQGSEERPMGSGQGRSKPRPGI